MNNPLTGPQGAAIYGPQKGATPEMVALLDLALANYDRILQRDLGQMWKRSWCWCRRWLGAGLMALLGGTLVSGIELVLDVLGFDEKVKGTGLVLTGEGKFDAQSAYGKVPMGVAAGPNTLEFPAL